MSYIAAVGRSGRIFSCFRTSSAVADLDEPGFDDSTSIFVVIFSVDNG